MHAYNPCVFYGKFKGGDDIPTTLLKKLQDQFTGVKVDMSNPLIYIGMKIDRTAHGIDLSMGKYESDLLSFCKMEGDSQACPNHSNKFNMASDDINLLDENEKSYFHTVMAKLLYLSKRTRPDLLTCVSVLCGRVLNPTVTDMTLLPRVSKYLSGTVGYGLCFNKVMRIDK